MARKWKAQAAIEYLMVFGIALLLSTPFVIKAQQSVVELRTGAQMLEARNSLNQIDSAARTVNAAGEPARRTFSISIPEAVQSTTVQDNYVMMSMNTSSSYIELSRTFEFNVSGTIPEAEGTYLVSATAENGGVHFEVVG